MRRPIATLLLTTTALVNPLVAGAQEVPERPTITVSGAATDPFGDPVEVCVFVRHAEVRYRPVTGFGEGQLTDPVTGAYSFDLPHGVYDLWAFSPIHSSASPGDPCPDPTPWTRINNETFVQQGPVRVTALADEAVDFELPYRLMGGTVDHEGCCGATASAPGGTVGVRAWTGRPLRDRVTVSWRDSSTGTTMSLPWDQPSWLELYDLYGCVPGHAACGAAPATIVTLPTEHGAYPYEIWAEAPDGTVVSEVRRGTAWVDTVAPTIERLDPREGQRGVYADAIRFQLDGYDDGPRISSVRLVLASADGPAYPATMSGYNDNESWYVTIRDVEPERTYTATFTATDRAGNVATAQSTFYVKAPPPDPCDPACQAPYLLEGVLRLVQRQL